MKNPGQERSVQDAKQVLRTYLLMKESKMLARGPMAGTPGAGAHCPDECMCERVCMSMHECVHVGMCEGPSACAWTGESLGLWNQSNLVSVPPLSAPLVFRFLFCESEDGDNFSYSVVGKMK